MPKARKDFLMNKGIAKLERDLDVVELLHIVQCFHVMKKLLFEKDERYLLKHKRANIVHAYSDAENNIKNV